MNIAITAIEYYLPTRLLTNRDLAKQYPDWTVDKIYEKTGINNRHITKTGETAYDLALKAAKKLFNTGVISPSEIDFILLATQSPDYILPTTACILQDALGIPKTSGALDFNLGCSAYIYGLALSKSLINSQIAKNVLLIMSETYSKHINPLDKSARTIFGDAAAASLISTNGFNIGNFDLGTDGSGKDALIIPSGGARLQKSEKTAIEINDNGSIRSSNDLYMDGPEIFSFTIRTVPQTIKKCLEKNHLTFADIDLFVFHQANKFMLDYLRKKIKISPEKFYMNMSDIGNTVSASIPIALKRAITENKIKPGDKIMLVGFGVGLSWGSTIITATKEWLS